MLFELEVQIQRPAVEHALKAMALGHLPLLVDDLERDVFVGGSSTESDHKGVWGVRSLQEVLRGLGLVQQVGVEDVELVALDGLRRRIVDVVVGLVVLVPVVPCLHCVEEARLAGLVAVFPSVLGDDRPAHKDVREFLLVLADPLASQLFVHAEGGIVEAHGIDVKPHQSVEGGFLDTFNSRLRRLDFLSPSCCLRELS